METTVKIQMKFLPGDTGKPFVHLFASQFGLVFSILQGEISPDKGGRLVMDLTGDAAAIEQALALAREKNISIRVLSRAIHWEEDACVHCGACTVCAQKALRLDPETATLRFDNAKCVVCEMCVDACPTGALRVSFFE